MRKLLKSFKVKVYDEDTGYGLLRHVLVRTSYMTGQIMVVLVVSSPIFPSKNHFVKALRAQHPEISTVVLNVNDRKTSMVLGPRNITLYGKGYIEDRLCGCMFRISPTSFYQINPVQTEKLYKTAMMLARLNQRNVVVDAYCGIGPIGIALSITDCFGIQFHTDDFFYRLCRHHADGTDATIGIPHHIPLVQAGQHHGPLIQLLRLHRLYLINRRR